MTKLERFSELPWGTIIAIVNVTAGVLGAIGMGIATLAQQLPPALAPKYGAELSMAAALSAAIAGGLYAVGKGLHRLGEGHTDQAMVSERNAILADRKMGSIPRGGPNTHSIATTPFVPVPLNIQPAVEPIDASTSNDPALD
jgi:hypothetical protein